MAPKALECLVVDGNYSKQRIGALVGVLLAFAVFIWLIVLTAKLSGVEKDDTRKHTNFLSMIIQNVKTL